MRAGPSTFPTVVIEERRRTGADRWDERWQGELPVRSTALGAVLGTVGGPRLAIYSERGSVERLN